MAETKHKILQVSFNSQLRVAAELEAEARGVSAVTYVRQVVANALGKQYTPHARNGGLEAVVKALSEGPATVQELSDGLGMGTLTVRKYLQELYYQGRASLRTEENAGSILRRVTWHEADEDARERPAKRVRKGDAKKAKK